MIKSFEDAQTVNREGFEALAASNTAVSRGYQTFAQEFADYSKKSFEKSASVWQTAVAAKSFDQAAEIQQAFAKDSFEAALAEFTKLGELAAAAAKSAYKPYEATFAAFGIKVPAAQ